VNPIAVKNNAIVNLHLNDEECSSKRFALHGELHWIAPHADKRQVGLHELIVLPSKFLNMTYNIKLTTASLSMSI
jgi:hypothetical protein